MRIGVNPLIWINDDEPDLGADVTLERCLAEARQAGYDGIELGHRFPTTEPELRPLLARHELALVSGWWGARLIERGAERELEALRPRVELLAAMGCTTLVFGETSGAVHLERRGLSERPVLDGIAWRRFARELDQLARGVLAHGVRLAFHHHVGTVVETPDDVDRLMRETSDAVGLLLDTGHLAWAGGDATVAQKIALRHADRIAHVHLKDVRGAVLSRALRDDTPFLDAVRDGVFTVPGDGSLGLEPVVAALVHRGYSSWIVVEAEQDPARAHPLTYAKLGFANASRMIARCREAVRSAASRARRALAGGARRDRDPSPTRGPRGARRSPAGSS